MALMLELMPAKKVKDLTAGARARSSSALHLRQPRRPRAVVATIFCGDRPDAYGGSRQQALPCLAVTVHRRAQDAAPKVPARAVHPCRLQRRRELACGTGMRGCMQAEANAINPPGSSANGGAP
mmetsp:Transcript_3980/g.12449  ORF Transcript_3980/g.12449 Transcript_3980/m.12449 type:complete len:124 (-) Transcript_3980:1738-2109(-)